MMFPIWLAISHMYQSHKVETYNGKQNRPIVPANRLGDPYANNKSQSDKERRESHKNRGEDDENWTFVDVTLRRNIW